MRTATDELLHLLGGHFGALPCVLPFGLRGGQVGRGGGFGLFLGRIGVFAPENSRKERHCRIGVTVRIDLVGFCGDGELRSSVGYFF